MGWLPQSSNEWNLDACTDAIRCEQMSADSVFLNASFYIRQSVFGLNLPKFVLASALLHDHIQTVTRCLWCVVCIVHSSGMLSHVERYEVVRPQRLQERHRRSLQDHPQVLTPQLHITGALSKIFLMWFIIKNSGICIRYWVSLCWFFHVR